MADRLALFSGRSDKMVICYVTKTGNCQKSCGPLGTNRFGVTQQRLALALRDFYGLIITTDGILSKQFITCILTPTQHSQMLPFGGTVPQLQTSHIG